MHATLDSHLVFDDLFNKQVAFLKNVLATFCRSDKFKSFYTFVLAFELIRSTKGSQNPFQKHDLLHIQSRKNIDFQNTNNNIIELKDKKKFKKKPYRKKKFYKKAK